MMRKVFLPVLFALLVATPRAPASVAAQAPADEAAVREVVRRLFDAFAGADLEAFMALWSRNSPDYAARRESMAQLLASTRDIRLTSLSIDSLAVEGDGARARVTAELTGTDSDTGQESRRLGRLRRSVSLVREGGVWKVTRYVPVEQELADALTSAATPEERRRLLDGASGFVTLELVRALLREAEARDKAGDTAGGLKLIDTAFESADRVGGPAGRAWCLWYRGSIYEKNGRADEALKDYEQSAALFREARDPELTTTLLDTVAVFMHKAGRWREGGRVAEESLRYARESAHKALEMRALNTLGLLRGSAGDYAGALAVYDEALKLTRARGLKSDESGVLGNMGVVLGRAGRYADALRAHEESLKIERERRSEEGAAQARLNIAGIHDSLGRHAEALAEYERLLEFFRARGMANEESMTLNNIGTLQLSIGGYDEALKAFEASLKLKRGAKDRPGESVALNNLANFYLLTARYGRAESLLRESLKLKEEMGDRAGVAAVLNNLANVHKAAGDYDAALAAARESLRISRAIGRPAGVAAALSTAGLVHVSRGEVADALTIFEESLKVAREIGDRAVEAGVLQNVGIVYDIADRADDALSYFERARVIEEEAGNRAGAAALLHNRANVFEGLGRHAEALAEYEKALKAAREIGDPLLEAQALHNMATAALRAGRREEAERNLEAALRIVRASNDRDLEPVVLNTLAESHLAAGRADDAVRALRDSLAISERSGDADTALVGHHNLGDIQRARGEWRQAVESYGRAVAYAESIRARAREHSLQIGLFGQYVSSYHGLADSLLRVGDAAGSFAASERAKARALVGLMEGGRAALAKAATAAEREEERRLAEEAAALTLQLEAVGARADADLSEIKRVAGRLASARAAYDEFSRRLFLAHPELEARRAQFEPADLAQLGAAFFAEEPNLCLLSYFVGTDETLLYVVTRGPSPASPAKLTAHRLPVGGEALSGLVGRFRLKLGAGPLGAGARRGIGTSPGSSGGHETEARALYDALVAPAGDELRGASHVVVITDPLLASLPFQALMDERKEHLVARHPVSYAPSATALLKMRARARQLSGDTKGGDTGGGGTATALAVGRPQYAGRHADLPASETEVRSIAALLGSRPLLGAEASEARVKSAAPRARYLHFAAHGLLNESAPMYSSIALAGGGGEDGALHARELMEMDLTAELAVLSACDTALGRRARGEGVLGLTWSLFVAGVPSSVVTQWAVADESTSQLMVEFYRELRAAAPRRPASKAEALRRAQLKLLADAKYNRPYYWAPFVLVGEWRN